LAVSTQCASRVSACSAEFAWIVLRLPEVPVLRACSRSNASGAAHLAHEDAIGPVPQGRPQQVGDGHGRQRRFLPERRLRAPRLEPHEVGLVDENLGRLLDQHDAVLAGIVAASAFSSVVLPVPVPPEMRMFRRSRRRAQRLGQRGVSVPTRPARPACSDA
jgi:hypothetical protein